jgi:hypothetical protein
VGGIGGNGQILTASHTLVQAGVVEGDSSGGLFGSGSPYVSDVVFPSPRAGFLGCADLFPDCDPAQVYRKFRLGRSFWFPPDTREPGTGGRRVLALMTEIGEKRFFGEVSGSAYNLMTFRHLARDDSGRTNHLVPIQGCGEEKFGIELGWPPGQIREVAPLYRSGRLELDSTIRYPSGVDTLRFSLEGDTGIFRIQDRLLLRGATKPRPDARVVLRAESRGHSVLRVKIWPPEPELAPRDRVGARP